MPLEAAPWPGLDSLEFVPCDPPQPHRAPFPSCKSLLAAIQDLGRSLVRRELGSRANTSKALGNRRGAAGASPVFRRTRSWLPTAPCGIIISLRAFQKRGGKGTEYRQGCQSARTRTTGSCGDDSHHSISSNGSEFGNRTSSSPRRR